MSEQPETKSGFFAMFTLREAVAGDYPRVIELLDHAHLFTQDIHAIGGKRWVLADGAEVVQGFIGLEVRGGLALLRSTVVAAEARSAGFGARLTAHALNWARQNAITRVYCFSTDAGGYWQRFGFVPAPVDELVAALPDASQVKHFERMGWLPTELAWRLDLSHPSERD
ncbi:MAG TPA: GNAT family N-acetyltransferase [Thermoflexales bacterium]|nr:GNAT family N-acetyltransferase [Thermoflexales bacterium]HQZ21920.1 GNAT family N-acetyltransferase [Thermoflexales bacterium]HQZ98740.1 GNAT family N-acetyltransferase [Thermoflexales bacterium]